MLYAGVIKDVLSPSDHIWFQERFQEAAIKRYGRLQATCNEAIAPGAVLLPSMCPFPRSSSQASVQWPCILCVHGPCALDLACSCMKVSVALCADKNHWRPAENVTRNRRAPTAEGPRHMPAHKGGPLTDTALASDHAVSPYAPHYVSAQMRSAPPGVAPILSHKWTRVMLFRGVDCCHWPC